MISTTIATFDETSWTRLRGVIEACKTRSNQVEQLNALFEEDAPLYENIQVCNLEVKIEEKRLNIIKLKRKLEILQKMLNSKRRMLYEVDEKLEKKKQDLEKINNKADSAGIKSATLLEENERIKKALFVHCRLFAVRKVSLIREVFDIFKIEIDGGPALRKARVERKDCRCVLVDTIRNLHLPHSNCVIGHNELETQAAFGCLVHALMVIAEILDYEMRYPLIASSSYSKIINPINDNIVLPLYNWRKRIDRDQFIEAMQCLERNIGQLRVDCGIPTHVTDKTLSVLTEWFHVISGMKKMPLYDRPVENIQSVSSLFVNSDLDLPLSFEN
ncbi:unnamed protein product [Caenorhabditis bovis]|uniref:Uncharacterized protein n=1 Tax=Caenorhabditis bovis TaxID=2654633 RepID=A0A8S1EEK4_9PELO|nr:unnamed protein product [Caenorhabditis bovis]